MLQKMDEILPVRYFSTIQTRKVDWLWYPYIPFGKITIIQGDPGDGKTTLVLNIAALLSNGLPMPEIDNIVNCSSVIYQSAEDSAEDTIKPRLISAGADCSRIGKRSIDRAKKQLGVKSVKLSDGWYWSLAEVSHG